MMRPGRPRQLLTVALMLAMGTVALEGTVVTTALPTIVGELQGLSLYPWVFSVYLLTSTTSVPIYGKLADIYGRKPVFMVGLGVFLLGTLLCGASASMAQLVAFRAVQGLGAGAVLPLTLTVMGDIYTLPERAKVQPLTASVWGIFSLVGPSAGALITVALSWRWVFWINAPVCLAALALLQTFLREEVRRRTVAIDYAGAATLTLGLVALLTAALEGGHAIAWGSAQMVALLGGAVVALAAFLVVERRAVDPVVPFRTFRERVVAVSSAGNLIMGVCMFGLTSYVPLFVQGVRGASAAGTSAVLTPLQVAWSASALLSGRLYVAVGFRPVALAGTALIAAGMTPLLVLAPETSLLLVSVGMGVIGVGLGMISSAFLLGPQSAVAWNLRGVVTSSTQFFRSIGGSVGVALMGAVLNARLDTAAAQVAAAAGGGGEDGAALVSAMLSQTGRAALPEASLRALAEGMASGLHQIYLALFVLALVGLVQVVLFARGRALETVGAQPGAEPAETGSALDVVPA